MNTLVFAKLDIGHATFSVIEESRDLAEKVLREAFDKYREQKPAYPWTDYKVMFSDMRVGEVTLDGSAYHMDPFNQKRWPDDYVQCVMTGDWFSPDDNPLAQLVEEYWILCPADHALEDIAETLQMPDSDVYTALGLEEEKQP